jgi:hypothetical protein
MFLELDGRQIVATAERLRDRIRERFPDANLARVADELVMVARTNTQRSIAIRRSSNVLRVLGVLFLLGAIAIVTTAVLRSHPEVIQGSSTERWRLPDVLQAIESTLGSIVFLGAGFAFVWTLDGRRKRSRFLAALHEMRAMAHIVDMHQMTKDPDRLLHRGPDTASSPARTTDRFLLSRYLDYCSEMLSLIGKVAALYVQGFQDPVALQAVDDIEDLTNGLSRKIWQKIVVLEQVFVAGQQADGAPAAASPATAAPAGASP